jgi:hypothetical protein
VFYRSQKELFENGAAAFQSQERPGQVEEKQKRIEFWERKVRIKGEVRRWKMHGVGSRVTWSITTTSA